MYLKMTMPIKTDATLLSVVVPCFNEEEVLETTHRRLVTVLDGLRMSWELLYVDDGSKDATADILRQLQAADARVRVVRFSRNFGHQLAVSAGLEHASGNAVVLIDADLQDPPEVIAEMVARWRDGCHVAYGLRTDRPGESAFKLWTAKLFYRLLNSLADVDIPIDTGDFRLMDRKVVDELLKMPEQDRFLRGMVTWVGFRQTAVPYERAPRFAGTSKYPLMKMLRLAGDGILSFSLTPLRLATGFGLTATALSLCGILFVLAQGLLTAVGVAGSSLMSWAILFLGGVQLVALGLLGEYVGRIYREIKRRPLYIVQERLGFEAQLTRMKEAA